MENGETPSSDPKEGGSAEEPPSEASSLKEAGHASKKSKRGRKHRSKSKSGKTPKKRSPSPVGVLRVEMGLGRVKAIPRMISSMRIPFRPKLTLWTYPALWVIIAALILSYAGYLFYERFLITVPTYVSDATKSITQIPLPGSEQQLITIPDTLGEYDLKTLERLSALHCENKGGRALIEALETISWKGTYQRGSKTFNGEAHLSSNNTLKVILIDPQYRITIEVDSGSSVTQTVSAREGQPLAVYPGPWMEEHYRKHSQFHSPFTLFSLKANPLPIAIEKPLKSLEGDSFLIVFSGKKNKTYEFLTVDSTTGELLEWNYELPYERYGKTLYSEFRSVQGIRLPYRITTLRNDTWFDEWNINEISLTFAKP